MPPKKRTPTPRKAPVRRPYQRPPGDATGRKAEMLQQEHAAAVREREGELGMVAARRQEIQDTEVVDLTQPGGPVLESTGQAVDTEAQQVDLLDDDDEETGQDANTSGSASYVVEELPEELSHTPEGGISEIPRELLNEKALIRCLYEVEDVTIGYGNTYTLREGYRYRVPYWVALHLEEKSICIILEAPAMATQRKLAHA